MSAFEDYVSRKLINEAGYGYSVTIDPEGQDYLNTHLNGEIIHRLPFSGLPLTSTLCEWSFEIAWQHYKASQNNHVMGVPQS